MLPILQSNRNFGVACGIPGVPDTRLQTPESATPITEFIENVYLPMVKQFLRPSTYKDYKRDAYEKHFKHRLGSFLSAVSVPLTDSV